MIAVEEELWLLGWSEWNLISSLRQISWACMGRELKSSSTTGGSSEGAGVGGASPEAHEDEKEGSDNPPSEDDDDDEKGAFRSFILPLADEELPGNFLCRCSVELICRLLGSSIITSEDLFRSFLRCKTDASPFESLLGFAIFNESGDRIQLSTLMETEVETDDADPALDIFPRRSGRGGETWA
jgi:hypothetical protein